MDNNFLITEIARVALVDERYEYPEDRTVFEEGINHNELIFQFLGNYTVTFKNQTAEILPNTIRFIPQGIRQNYSVLRKVHGFCILTTFKTDSAISDKMLVLKVANPQKIGALFKKMFSIWVAKNDGYYFECISILYKIFAELQKENYIPENKYLKIKPAVEYIEENFLATEISSEYLSEICSISYSYLKRIFIEKFGVSPKKYIINLKMNYACDLLKSEKYSVSQIALMSGYNDVYFFSRQFKEYIGISPLEFRKKYKSSK